MRAWKPQQHPKEPSEPPPAPCPSQGGMEGRSGFGFRCSHAWVMVAGEGSAVSSGFECGWGVGGLHVGLAAHFGCLPVDAPQWRLPWQEERAAQLLTSARACQEPGSTGQESPSQGTMWGVPSPRAHGCLCH